MNDTNEIPFFDGMTLSAKGSNDCFEESVYTIAAYGADKETDIRNNDIVDVLNFFKAITSVSREALVDNYPYLSLIDSCGHTFLHGAAIIKDLKRLRAVADDHDNTVVVAKINKIIDFCQTLDSDHVIFLFDGM